MACTLSPPGPFNAECYVVPSRPQPKATWEIDLVGTITMIEFQPGKSIIYSGKSRVVVYGQFSGGLQVGDRIRVYADREGVLHVELVVENF